MPIPASLTARLRRWRRLIAVLAGVYILWILAGFFLIPALARPRIEREASRALKRPVTVAKLRFNPFTFGATLEGFRVAERGGGDWITLSRICWRTMARRKPEPRMPLRQAGSWRWAASRCGRGGWNSRTARRRRPSRPCSGPSPSVSIGLRTEVGHRSGVSLEAWTEAKEHLAWKGDLGFQPFASKGTLLIENLSLPKYRPYEQGQVSSEIRGGTASLRAQYRFEWGQGRRIVEVSDVGLTWKDVKIAERGVAEPALELPLLEILEGKADLLAATMELGSITADQGAASVQGLEARDALQNEPFLRWKQLRLSGADIRTEPFSVAIKTMDWTDPEGHLVVQPDGNTNVARALRLVEEGKPAPVTASAIPATPAAAPDLAIAKLGISGGCLSFIDRSVQPNAALVLSDLEGSYRGLSSTRPIRL